MSEIRKSTPNKATYYKLRAECLHDVVEFVGSLYRIDYTTLDFMVSPLVVDGRRLPDVELIFRTELSLNTLKEVLKNQSDSHVMLETINPVELYTGERN